MMATVKKDDVFSTAAFDPSKFAESFRDFAEKGAQQSREAYAKMKTAAEDAGKTVEATMQNAQAGTVELGLKAIDALRTNAENSLSHMEALLGVKSVAEFFELQTSFIRKQAELTTEQAKSMQETSKKVAEKLAKPAKDAAEKVIASFKAA
jgi:phasin